MKTTTSLSALLESFFTDRLMRQRQVSPHTIVSYRDTFRLLLEHARERLKKAPSDLQINDVDAHLVVGFLEHLEHGRSNSVRTRNLRLTAIQSFFRYVAFQEPALAAHIQRVLAIPSKRHRKRMVGFLPRPEIDAFLSAPDVRVWAGRRDHALMLVAIETGLRVSELTGLRPQDIELGAGAHVRCSGKGRKERCTPLSKQAVKVLRAWLREHKGTPSDPLFPNMRGGQLSQDGVQYILDKHLSIAQTKCSTLKKKRVTPHLLRHSTAMRLLQAGVDRSVIALWLGHESVETTQIYIDANLKLKEKALAKANPLNGRARRYRPEDHLLAFLKGL